MKDDLEVREEVLEDSADMPHIVDSQLVESLNRETLSKFPVYRKGFPDESLRKDLFAVIDEGVDRPQKRTATDCQLMENILRAQITKIGDGCMNPLVVDPDIYAGPLFHKEIFFNKAPSLPSFEEFTKDVQFVKDLVPLRDKPLATLEEAGGVEIPDTMKKLSWLLRDKLVKPYSSGLDYMTTEAEVESILAGVAPTEKVKTKFASRITTGRHMATLVHADDPVAETMFIINQLNKLGVRRRVPSHLVENSLIGRFTNFGTPWVEGRIGNLLSICGFISFRNKWKNRVARPEQAGPELGIGIIPQCFPEGSPCHPSMNAMHFFVYASIYGWLTHIYDQYHILPSNTSVADELFLWLGAYVDGRVWAGVHTRQTDNWNYLDQAVALGKLQAITDLKLSS